MRAVVAGVLDVLKIASKWQGRRLLLLWEHEAEHPTFFLGGWGAWSRIPGSSTSTTDSNDINANVKYLTEQQMQEMAAAWKDCEEFSGTAKWDTVWKRRVRTLLLWVASF